MKRVLMVIPLLFAGCSFTQTSQKVTHFAKCYVNEIPAPFWICYQSPFISVGKVYTKEVSRLKQEEAYAKGVKELVEKLSLKVSQFLDKLEVKNKKEIISQVKEFIILNSIETNTWYSKKNNILYVEVELNKKEFKRYLFSLLKEMDKKKLEIAFNETF